MYRLTPTTDVAPVEAGKPVTPPTVVDSAKYMCCPVSHGQRNLSAMIAQQLDRNPINRRFGYASPSMSILLLTLCS
jgi:hypothetical protein